MNEQQGPAPCKTCRRDTLHTTVRPVSRGQTYIACSVCSTVSHFPTPPVTRST